MILLELLFSNSPTLKLHRYNSFADKNVQSIPRNQHGLNTLQTDALFDNIQSPDMKGIFGSESGEETRVGHSVYNMV